MSKKRAFVRFTKNGKIVPGSLVITNGSHPEGPAVWQEIPYDICCENPQGVGNCNCGNNVQLSASLQYYCDYPYRENTLLEISDFAKIYVNSVICDSQLNFDYTSTQIQQYVEDMDQNMNVPSQVISPPGVIPVVEDIVYTCDQMAFAIFRIMMLNIGGPVAYDDSALFDNGNITGMPTTYQSWYGEFNLVEDQLGNYTVNCNMDGCIVDEMIRGGEFISRNLGFSIGPAIPDGPTTTTTTLYPYDATIELVIQSFPSNEDPIIALSAGETAPMYLKARIIDGTVSEVLNFKVYIQAYAGFGINNCQNSIDEYVINTLSLPANYGLGQWKQVTFGNIGSLSGGFRILGIKVNNVLLESDGGFVYVNGNAYRIYGLGECFGLAA
jgi:hypothetical protein